MRLMIKIILSGFLYGFLALASAATDLNPWFFKDTNNQVILKVDLFISSTCPHCKKADQFFKDLEKNHHWITVRRYVINEDKSALETYNQLLQKEKMRDFIVPAVFFCNTRWPGFDNADTTGKQILRNMLDCREQIAKTGSLSPATEQLLRQESSANWFQDNIPVSNTSPGLMLVMTALIAAVDPCTGFVILTLFSFLMIQKKWQERMAIVVLFLAGAGLSQHILQAHTIFYYQALMLMRVTAVVTGLLLLVWADARHFRIFIKKQNIPALIAMLLVFLTAFTMQTFQQNHTPNVSLVAHKLILSQDYLASQQVIWHMLFQFIYLLMAGLSTLSLVALMTYIRRWSKHMAWTNEFAFHFLVIIALILAVSPDLFSQALFSFLAFVLALLSSFARFRIWRLNGSHDAE